MNRLIRKLTLRLPKDMRQRAMRRLVQIAPDVAMEFEFDIARSQEDLEAAFQILHETYVDQGYMTPNPSGLRITKYHALPTTTTLVAKFGGQVVGTLSIIRDSSFGLPLDDAFDLEPLREQYSQIAEISSLAIRKKFRTEHGKLLWPLLKFFYHYSKHIVRLKAVLIGVHPRWADFYVGLLGFQHLHALAVDEYEFANGNPVEGFVLDLESAPDRYAEMYGHRPITSNLHAFFTSDCAENFHLPRRDFYKISDSVMTPDLLDYFFVRKSPVLDALSDREILSLFHAYPLNEYRHLLSDRVRPVDRRRRGELRFDVSCRAMYHDGPALMHLVEVVSASLHGVAIRGELPAGELQLKVQVGEADLVELRAETIWSADGFSGVRIVEPPATWSNFLHYLGEDFAAKDVFAMAQGERS
jgi:hypothetical protein